MKRVGRRARTDALDLGLGIVCAWYRDLSAVAVDRIVGYHEVVVKPLGDPLDRLEWLSGATILGDGKPILILDLPKTLRLRAA